MSLVPLARLRPIPIALLALAACAAAALAIVPGCGSSDPKTLNDEGYTALNSGDRKAALECFDESIAALGANASDPQYLRAHLGAVEARAYTDPERAVTDFTALAVANPAAIGDRDYGRVASQLADAKAFPEAIAVLEGGKAAYPESQDLHKAVQAVGKMAERAGDKSATKALEGLGYVGGD